jgi:hypothetical protein
MKFGKWEVLIFIAGRAVRGTVAILVRCSVMPVAWLGWIIYRAL